MTEKFYVPSDIIQQSQPYRIDTKPFEKLMYKKTDIAAELAHRDIEIEQLQARVAELEEAVAIEREACAQICEGLPSKHAEMNYMHEDACMACAEAIRARGEKP